MKVNEKRELFISYCNQIKKLGYRVFVSKNNEYNYAYFTDGINIGNCYLNDMGGISFSTVHVPNTSSGRGFAIDNKNNCFFKFTRSEIINSFVVVPSWYFGGCSKGIKKYTFEQFKNKKDFERVIEL